MKKDAQLIRPFPQLGSAIPERKDFGLTSPQRALAIYALSLQHFRAAKAGPVSPFSSFGSVVRAVSRLSDGITPHHHPAAGASEPLDSTPRQQLSKHIIGNCLQFSLTRKHNFDHHPDTSLKIFQKKAPKRQAWHQLKLTASIYTG